jgi:hypothetical protein
MMESELTGSMSLQAIPVQKQQQDFETEVWDHHKTEVEQTIQEVLYPAIENHPETTKIISVVGESGIMKGVLLSQGAQRLPIDPLLEAILDTAGKSLRFHYLSTSMLVREGISRGWIETAYGSGPAGEALDFTTRKVDEGLRRAETELPETDPDAVHVLLEELVAVDETRNLGTSIIERQGKSADALVIFAASNPQIQERTYYQRKALWEGNKDPKQILKSHGTVLDMEGEAARMTMGSHGAIERITGIVNQAMYEAWVQEQFLLPEGPNKVPWEILRSEDPRDMTKKELEEFFTTLTSFDNGEMKTKPIRPYLQVGYYEYLAEKWGVKQAKIFLPHFITETIHGYPGHLAEKALPIAVYINSSKRSKNNGDIFMAGTGSPS